MLYQLGLLQFQVIPFNTDTVTFETGADFAARDVIGGPRPRDFTGEADTRLKFSGKLFPHRFGGLYERDLAEQMATSRDPQMLARGEGAVMGGSSLRDPETRDHAGCPRSGVGERRRDRSCQIVRCNQRAEPDSGDARGQSGPAMA